MRRKLSVVFAAAVFFGMCNAGLSQAEEEGYEKLNPNALEKYKMVFYNGCDQLLDEPLETDFLDLVTEIVGTHCKRASSELARLEEKAWQRDFLVGLEPSRAFQEAIETLSQDFAKARVDITKCAQHRDQCDEAEGKCPEVEIFCGKVKEDLKGLRAYIYAFGRHNLKELKRSIKPAPKDQTQEKKEKAKKEQKRQSKINPYVE